MSKASFPRRCGVVAVASGPLLINGRAPGAGAGQDANVSTLRMAATAGGPFISVWRTGRLSGGPSEKNQYAVTAGDHINAPIVVTTLKPVGK